MPRKKVLERRKLASEIYRVESFANESFGEFKKRQRDLKKKMGGLF